MVLFPVNFGIVYYVPASLLLLLLALPVNCPLIFFGLNQSAPSVPWSSDQRHSSTCTWLVQSWWPWRSPRKWPRSLNEATLVMAYSIRPMRQGPLPSRRRSRQHGTDMSSTPTVTTHYGRCQTRTTTIGKKSGSCTCRGHTNT